MELKTELHDAKVLEQKRRYTMYGPKPTSWKFTLDDRTTHMSLIEISEATDPIFATPDSIREHIDQFPNSKATPLDVSALLDMSNKLFITSVIYYEFAAISVEKALQALELAVRTHLKAGRNVKFGKLIERLKERGIHSQQEIELFNLGRKLRNSFAHPNNVNAFSMVMTAGFLRAVHQLISTLFVDPNEVSN